MMTTPRIAFTSLAVLSLALGAPALASDDTHAHAGFREATARSERDVQVVQLSVTKDGFVPSSVTVKAGKPVKLVVTRSVERTCATEIVMRDFGLKQPLPLGTPVAVTVTPKKAGDYRYACGMDMIAGVLKVE